MSSRDIILARIRDAVAADGDPVVVPREYDRGALSTTTTATTTIVDLFTERLTDYKAEVQRTGPDGVAAAVLGALATSASVVVPDGLPAGLLQSLRDEGRQLVVDGDPADLSAHELDEIDAVVTLATVAIAANGTIVLDAGAGQGRRIISLIPDLHVVVVRAGQVVANMPEAIALLDPVRPTTLIAGPSATSDIELSRVEGVHGPRTLRVVLVEDHPV